MSTYVAGLLEGELQEPELLEDQLRVEVEAASRVASAIDGAEGLHHLIGETTRGSPLSGEPEQEQAGDVLALEVGRAGVHGAETPPRLRGVGDRGHQREMAPGRTVCPELALCLLASYHD